MWRKGGCTNKTTLRDRKIYRYFMRFLPRNRGEGEGGRERVIVDLTLVGIGMSKKRLIEFSDLFSDERSREY